MSPLQIEILLWYHSRAEDYRQGDFTAPAVRDAIDWFKGIDNMLELKPPVGGSDYRTYQLTPRGQAFVDHITSLELPVAQWTVPNPPHKGSAA